MRCGSPVAGISPVLYGPNLVVVRRPSTRIQAGWSRRNPRCLGTPGRSAGGGRRNLACTGTMPRRRQMIPDRRGGRWHTGRQEYRCLPARSGTDVARRRSGLCCRFRSGSGEPMCTTLPSGRSAWPRACPTGNPRRPRRAGGCCLHPRRTDRRGWPGTRRDGARTDATTPGRAAAAHTAASLARRHPPIRRRT